MSRNEGCSKSYHDLIVTPREGRVSRNRRQYQIPSVPLVTPREGRVSRNRNPPFADTIVPESRPARGV